MERWEEFTCLNSLREVEPSVKLIVNDGGLDDIPNEIVTQNTPPENKEHP